MTSRILVPHLDANAVDVTITAWRKAPGELVTKGEIIAELTTDKATFELESIASGTLLTILAALKSVVPSGYIIAILGNPGETDPDAIAHNAALLNNLRPPVAAADGRGSPLTLPSIPSPARIRATPRARRLAQEHGLDLARIQAETHAEVIDEAVLQKYLAK